MRARAWATSSCVTWSGRRVLVHLLDGSRPDPVADLRTLNRELAWYSEELGQKRQQVVVNKLDLPEVRARRARAGGKSEGPGA